MLRRRRRDSLTPAENVCSYEKLAEVVEALNATMEKTETGTVLTDYVDYLQHMGTDAWVDCISIVTNSMEDAWVEETQETTECVVADPCDWMTMDHSDETLVEACNHGSWGYCADHPEHAWCADPCCNWDMQQTMCWRSEDATVSVFRPKLKTESRQGVHLRRVRKQQNDRIPLGRPRVSEVRRPDGSHRGC